MFAHSRRAFLGASLAGLVSGRLLAEDKPPKEGADEDAFQPSTLFLTWQRDPTTTMTVQWIGPAEGANAPAISYSRHSQNDWRLVETRALPFPTTNRSVFGAELTGLSSGTEYEFRIGMEQTARDFG